MSQVKAEFNHKSCAERYDVIETLDTPVLDVRYFENLIFYPYALKKNSGRR